jgi:hypothetical protein
VARTSQRTKLALAACGLAVLALGSGCEKASSSALPLPDFRGTWDVTFDDEVAIDVRVGEKMLHGRLDGEKGTLELEDGGHAVSLQLDCAASELVCPAEVLPRELVLAGPLGQLDADGVQLAKPLAGLGQGACVARPGSFLTGEVLSSAGLRAERAEAVAITGGRATVWVSAGCFGEGSKLPAGSEVLLTSGFTAAKR